jgi:hypothetical protein
MTAPTAKVMEAALRGPAVASAVGRAIGPYTPRNPFHGAAPRGKEGGAAHDAKPSAAAQRAAAPDADAAGGSFFAPPFGARRERPVDRLQLLFEVMRMETLPPLAPAAGVASSSSAATAAAAMHALSSRMEDDAAAAADLSALRFGAARGALARAAREHEEAEAAHAVSRRPKRPARETPQLEAAPAGPKRSKVELCPSCRGPLESSVRKTFSRMSKTDGVKRCNSCAVRFERAAQHHVCVLCGLVPYSKASKNEGLNGCAAHRFVQVTPMRLSP